MDLSLRRRAVRHLRRADPVMAGIIETVGPCRLEIDPQPPFAALLESIVYQQLTGRAAATIHGRVLKALGIRRHPRPEHVAAATDEVLRGAGLSRAKVLAIRDLAQRAPSLPFRRLFRMENDAIVESLTVVRGIGRWTVEMYLIFRLGRPDVLPVHDYGIRKAMQRAYRLRELPSPDRMEKIAAKWRPWRTVACWYLWRSLETKGGRA
ncbi:MAG TPA: DNA-3-methyladenine glycosylase 2 family protein [Vicinamibacteria bacterium]|nr:DNA-3-methyladenine glycosylase 2 family protein [Vicinamibacteria bacterium]